MSTTLLRTPLLERHRAADGKLVPFAGWEMPLDYGSILDEARMVRSAAGLFDVSHMARIRVDGPQAAAALDSALAATCVDLESGKARYTLLLQEDAGILDDLIVYRQGEERFLLVLNAANRERDLDALLPRLTASPPHDCTEDGGGILALQGPDSAAVLASICGEDSPLGFLELRQLDVRGVGRLWISRTGYTGEHGYELFFEPGQGPSLWDLLLEAGARPAGLGCRDVLRLEAAMPLYGHEIHEGIDPFTAGLRFGCRGWKERTFVGGDALRALPDPTRGLVGLTSPTGRVPRNGYQLLQGDRAVGTVCSGAFSATLNKPIATAYLDLACDGPLECEHRGRRFPVERVDLPFVPHRSRN